MQGKRQNSEGTQPTSVLLGRIIKDWTTENIQLDAGVVPGALEKICEWREFKKVSTNARNETEFRRNAADLGFTRSNHYHLRQRCLVAKPNNSAA
jgi:hypothetical protein